jgi:hypothetical protein
MEHRALGGYTYWKCYTSKDCWKKYGQPSGGPCKEWKCKSDGRCEERNKQDWTSCDDGQKCTTDDKCINGKCEGKPKVCPASGDQCKDNVCSEKDWGKCVPVPKNGTPCDDGKSCTSKNGKPGYGDECKSGKCVGMPVDCGSGDQCNEKKCNASDGKCVKFPKTDGTHCDDTNPCTSKNGKPGYGDECKSGKCVGEPVVCSDGIFCNGEETCDRYTGSCKAGMSPDCNDDNKCTKDYCDEKEDKCKNKPTNRYYLKCGKGLFLCGIEKKEIEGMEFANGYKLAGCNTGAVDDVYTLGEHCENDLDKYTKYGEKCPNGKGLSNYGIFECDHYGGWSDCEKYELEKEKDEDPHRNLHTLRGID